MASEEADQLIRFRSPHVESTVDIKAVKDDGTQEVPEKLFMNAIPSSSTASNRNLLASTRASSSPAENLPDLQRPLAIVGMECRLPGGDNLEAFWRLLQSGASAITKMPSGKLDRDRYYHPTKGRRGKTYSDIGGMIDERELDWSIMPIDRRQSVDWDESHLILCEVVASALPTCQL